jgi:multisubunit Na+/H+ antiporter MnhG subunit
MDTKALLKNFSAVLWVLGFIILAMIIISWFVDYPKWLDQLLTNALLIGLGVVSLYQSYRLRQRDKTFSAIYLILGLILIVVAFVNFAFIKIIAIAGLIIFILTRPFIKKKLRNNETQP